jgi:hypothetical protein
MTLPFDPARKREGTRRSARTTGHRARVLKFESRRPSTPALAPSAPAGSVAYVTAAWERTTSKLAALVAKEPDAAAVLVGAVEVMLDSLTVDRSGAV